MNNLQSPRWQKLLSECITHPALLLDLLELDHALLPAAIKSSQLFNLRVPRGFVARMRKNDLADPLLRQVLPLDAECQETPGYSTDPLAEAHANPIPGLLHKYHGRVLLTVVGACAINCRYCFRRHFPYAENNPGRRGWEKALDYIRADASIKEVILSGGDPLIASDEHLAELVNKIAGISHVTSLRVHSRLPIVLPERVTDKMIAWLTATRLKTVMIIHANHANEIDQSVIDAISLFRRANIYVLNQSVLLHGVNDDAEALINLSEKLFHAGVLPYYLHMLDKVSGTAHFAVNEEKAHELRAAMMAKLPGYLVPKFAREVDGAASKLWI